ncbi:hypothetical protein MBH78_13485 [Oceanimonas sp. NS1]|nr:hypothetical protein [Oceanimonas sp. NS1]
MIQQAVVLLAMGWLLTLNARKGRHHPRLAIVTTGFWFGLAAVVCMLLPFTVAPGVLLDARSGVILWPGCSAVLVWRSGGADGGPVPTLDRRSRCL